MFSRRSVAGLIRSLIKLCLVGAVAYLNLRREFYLIPRLPLVGLSGYVNTLGTLVWRLLWQCGLAILLLSAGDYAYQRWEYEQSLRMSIQEIKEEFRQTEGSPEQRGHIRERQRQLARARMMHQVPRQMWSSLTRPTMRLRSSTMLPLWLLHGWWPKEQV